jgi:hypothetical protein
MEGGGMISVWIFVFQLSVRSRIGDKTLLLFLRQLSAWASLSEMEWCTVSQLELFPVLLLYFADFYMKHNYSFLISGSNHYYEDHFTLETLS